MDANQTTTLTFTQEELDAISEGLNQQLLDGFADGNSHPIVTALMKVAPETPKQFEDD